MYSTVREAMESFWIDTENGQWKTGMENGFTADDIMDLLDDGRPRNQVQIEINIVMQSLRRQRNIQCGGVKKPGRASVTYIIAGNHGSADGGLIAGEEVRRAKAFLSESRINSERSPDPQVRAYASLLVGMIAMLNSADSTVMIADDSHDE